MEAGPISADSRECFVVEFRTMVREVQAKQAAERARVGDLREPAVNGGEAAAAVPAAPSALALPGSRPAGAGSDVFNDMIMRIENNYVSVGRL
ncbi:hypothetical protein FOA52_006198 [Chlamydomonas sp. UWO 241]|nr:hypothetical protein FOA52_006198 [Chlamydomonas sp. UWO 241]